MLKKLLIPFFVISVAAVASNGCGSSSNTSGTAGKGGTAGAGGGTAGAGTAGSGTAGSGTAGAGTAGSGTAGAGTAGSGSAGAAAGTDGGSAGAGTAGADGGSAGAGTAGTDGGSDASDSGAPNVAALKLECPTKITAANAATPFTADEFCALYADACGSMTFTGALTSADCVATYNSWATKKIMGSPTVGVQNCVSYHVCNAESSATAPATHCPHAAATASPMVCTPAN
jgi:hypothetical protein